MVNLQKHLSKRIADLRIKADLTQARFAELANVSNDTISRIERGERSPSFAVLERIAKALNIEVSELFNFSNRKYHKQKWPLELTKLTNYLENKSPGEIRTILKISELIFKR